MSAVGRYFGSADGKWLIAVFVIALAVRLLALAYIHPDPRDGRYDDSVWYDTTARHLANGEGYVFDPTVWVAADGSRIYPNEDELSPTALWPPGYPLTLAVVYALTGDSVTAGQLLNVLFGALTVALVFLIARKLFDRTAAVFAAVALAFLPSHVLFTTVLLSETYFGFLLALVLCALVYFVLDPERDARGSPWSLVLIAGVGVVAAFAGYVRGEFLAYGGVIALMVLLRYGRQSVLPLAALAGGAAIVVVPWTVRNVLTMDELVVGTTGAGRVMYQGHNPDTDGGPSLIATGQLEAEFADLSRKELELESNREGSRLAREWALDHPLEELELVPKRLFKLFRSDEAGVTWLQSNKPWLGAEGADKLIRISSFAFFGLIAMSLASARLWWRPMDPRFWAVFGVVPFYMVVFGVLFIGDPRYHYAMYIPLAVFAAPGFALLWRLTGDHWRAIAGDRSLMSVLRTYGTPPAS
jgi:4-amino-4-deoxy-L-arabinose transferase-like glycosyltransferase